MEFADPQKRPEKAPAQPIWESLQSNDPGQETVIPGYGLDYGKGVPGLQNTNSYELPLTTPSREEGDGGTRDTRMAQSFAGENGVQWDPVSELFKVIFAGVVVGVKSTLDAASDLYQQVMKSQRGRQGDAGDTGIREETQGLIEQAKAEGKDLTTKEALGQLMREAKLPNGKPDNKRKQRIKAEQKEQEARQSRESKDKPKPKKKK
jgi:hypothetical protein